MNTMWLFWGQSTMAYLRYLTLKSACAVHDDVCLITRDPKLCGKGQWITPEALEFQGESPSVDWMPRVRELPLRIVDIVEVAPTLANMVITDNHAKDLLSYYMLATQGGTFADMDILFVKPIREITHDVQVPFIRFRGPVDLRTNRQKELDAKTGTNWREKPNCKGYVPMGFMQGWPCEAWKNAYQLALDRLDPADYHSCAFCLDQRLGGDLPVETVYPWTERHGVSRSIGYCFDGKWPALPNDTRGIHWYAGGNQKAIAELDGPDKMANAPGAVPFFAVKLGMTKCQEPA
jgi:hypothetical protein